MGTITIRTKLALVAVALVFSGTGAVACKGKPNAGTSASPTSPAASKLTDLSTSLDAVRASFNAHKQEARFLTLLSPA
jgi:hypothetical protein